MESCRRRVSGAQFQMPVAQVIGWRLHVECSEQYYLSLSLSLSLPSLYTSLSLSLSLSLARLTAYPTSVVVVVLFLVVSPFSLHSIHGDPPPLKVCTHARRTSPVNRVIGSGFPLEGHFTPLQFGFQLVFLGFPLSTGFPLAI